MSNQERIASIVRHACLALALGVTANTLADDTRSDPLAGLKLPTMLADASEHVGDEMTGDEAETATGEISPRCADS